MLNLPIDLAQIVALFMESVFYGLYLVTFGMCMYIMLVKGRSSARRRAIFVAVSISMFAVATFDVILLLIHVLEAFIWYDGPGGAVEEFFDISYWVNAIRLVTYAVQTSIGDGVLIYRCYLVYGRSWIAAIPLSILWIAGIATEGIESYAEFALHQHALLSTEYMTPYIMSVQGITLALNVLTTSLIAYKIWAIERMSREACPCRNSGSLRRAIRIVVESGLMYTFAVIINMAVYMAGSNLLYGVSDCVIQIIGISFNLVIIRIDQGKTVETQYTLGVLRSEELGEQETRSALAQIIFNRSPVEVGISRVVGENEE